MGDRQLYTSKSKQKRMSEFVKKCLTNGSRNGNIGELSARQR